MGSKAGQVAAPPLLRSSRQQIPAFAPGLSPERIV